MLGWRFVYDPANTGLGDEMRPGSVLGAALLVAGLAATACESTGDSGGGPTGGTTGSGGAGAGATGGHAGTAGAGANVDGGAAGAGGTLGAACATSVAYDDAVAWVAAYKAAHPGNGGKDWDINAKSAAELAADPAAQQLLSICGVDQRPVIPELAWEYGGNDHPWIDAQASALAYCDFIPVADPSVHWQYDAATDHVTADVCIPWPEHNPCTDMPGADQVAACIGDPTNFEILVDIASLHDGADAGLSLAEASTELMLVLPDGTRVHLWTNL